MPIICEDIVENEKKLLSKAVYAGANNFVKVYASPAPTNTPLGIDYKFLPCFLPKKYKAIATDIEEFEVHSDDTWVITFPKCGTTWSQTMIWLLNNNLDYELESKTKLVQKFPFLEFSIIFEERNDFIELARNTPQPRHIKTHLPAGLIPRQIWTVKPKIVYVARNPKDVAVSFFHHYCNMHGYRGSFNDFIDAFLNDYVIWAPFHSHILEFWKMRNEENILFITYEEMQSNLMDVVKRTAKFLGKSNCYTDEQLRGLCDHLHMDKMRLNPAANNDEIVKNLAANLKFEKSDPNFRFIRKGKSGTFSEEMTPEIINRFNEWTAKELKDSDFKFQF